MYTTVLFSSRYFCPLTKGCSLLSFVRIDPVVLKDFQKTSMYFYITVTVPPLGKKQEDTNSFNPIIHCDKFGWILPKCFKGEARFFQKLSMCFHHVSTCIISLWQRILVLYLNKLWNCLEMLYVKIGWNCLSNSDEKDTDRYKYGHLDTLIDRFFFFYLTWENNKVQDTHEPHRSHEKTVPINTHIKLYYNVD